MVLWHFLIIVLGVSMSMVYKSLVWLSLTQASVSSSCLRETTWICMLLMIYLPTLNMCMYICICIHICNSNFSTLMMLSKIAFLSGSDGKTSACNAGDLGSIPGSGRFPCRRKCQTTTVLLPGKFHEWRSLVGYSPRDRKESDMTEQFHTHSHLTLVD